MKEKGRQYPKYKHYLPDDWAFRLSCFDSPSEYVLFEHLFGFDSPEEFQTHWKNFSGNVIEFNEYARDFLSGWTSLNPSETLDSKTLQFLCDVSYSLDAPSSTSEQSSAKELACEYEFISEWLYGDDAYFTGFGEVVLDPFEEEAASYDLEEDSYCSRFQGNHARYRRRCDEARSKKRRVQLGIGNVYDEGGSLQISGSYLWRKFNEARDALASYAIIRKTLGSNPSFHATRFNLLIKFNKEAKKIETALGNDKAINFFRDTYKVPHLKVEYWAFIVKKYKKLVSSAKYYAIYYDSHFFVSEGEEKTECEVSAEVPDCELRGKQHKEDYANFCPQLNATFSKKQFDTHCNLRAGVKTHLDFRPDKLPALQPYSRCLIRYLPTPCYPAYY